jgi:hypothetical protein
MLNDLMWLVLAHLVFLSIVVVPTVALVWVAHVSVKALKQLS